jgi:hypothetical protein
MSSTLARTFYTLLIATAVPASLSAQPVEAGVARDVKHDTPYECLHVALLDSSGKAVAHTVTDSAGQFFLEAPRPGAYRVQFTVFHWEPLVGPVDTLAEADFRQRAYPLAFENMLVADSAYLGHRDVKKEDRQRYTRLYGLLREQEGDSGWRSREPIPKRMDLRYPDALRRSGIEGGVVGQFIVDSTGTTRPNSWHAIAVTHPDFEKAVVKSIPDWRWKPARNRGSAVCELTFDFISFSRDGNLGRIVLETR